jgi:hypothetical protein
MNLIKIYTLGDSQFAQRIAGWCRQNKIDFHAFSKEEKVNGDFDGLVIFHEDHNLDAVELDMRKDFEKKLKPIHKIDVNGTKQVSISHFGLWLERNGCKELLMVGNEKLINNDSFESLLQKMGSK